MIFLTDNSACGSSIHISYCCHHVSKYTFKVAMQLFKSFSSNHHHNISHMSNYRMTANVLSLMMGCLWTSIFIWHNLKFLEQQKTYPILLFLTIFEFPHKITLQLSMVICSSENDAMLFVSFLLHSRIFHFFLENCFLPRYICNTSFYMKLFPIH